MNPAKRIGPNEQESKGSHLSYLLPTIPFLGLPVKLLAETPDTGHWVGPRLAGRYGITDPAALEATVRQNWATFVKEEMGGSPA